MKRALKPRRDIDGEPPAWVMKTDPRIPRCIKCGTQVPNAKVLHTLCRNCHGSDDTVRHHDVKALIRGVIAMLDEKAVDQLVQTYGKAAADDRVRYHAERLVARGLDGAMAYRQAASLVADPAHREACEICRSGGAPGCRPASGQTAAQNLVRQ